MSLALEIHEESKCSGCGHYADEAWDPDADGHFEVDDSLVCAACAARERHTKDEKSREPGQMLRTYDARVEGYKPVRRPAPPAPDAGVAKPAAPVKREETVG